MPGSWNSPRLDSGAKCVRIYPRRASDSCNLRLRLKPFRLRRDGSIINDALARFTLSGRFRPSRVRRHSLVGTEAPTMSDPNATPAPEESRSASAPGERAVAVSGPVSESVIVTGDHNSV